MSFEVKINGITYESKHAIDGCDGCVTEPTSKLCNAICASKQGCTVGMNVIWLKKETTEQTEEPKYTVKEVLEAVEQVTDEYFTDYQTNMIKELLTKQNNPEYKLYLELKAKFGE